MASPFQKTPSCNKQLMDLECINRSFNQDQQVAVYMPPEDRRMQTGMFKGHEMEDMHLGGMRKLDRAPLALFCLKITDISQGDIRTSYLYAPSPSAGRVRGRMQGLEYDNDGEAEYREPGGNAGYARDGFGHGDDNPYGNDSEMVREKINDKTVGRGNAEYLSGNQHWTSDAGLYNGHSSMNVEVYDEDDDGMEDGERVFVPEDSQFHNIQHSAKNTVRQSGRPMPSGEFNAPLASNPRLPPISSRVYKRTNVNLVPPTVATSSISDAALLKRGLKRSKNAVMSKRSHGPNDPENILIVNLRENEKKSWGDICLILNERRIKEGKTPSFTPNGCHNRYNRNAPILFAAEGKEFVPVSVQRKLKKNPNGPIKWDDETDILLIQCVKEVESHKWDKVAALFNANSQRQITPAEAALRTKVI